MSMIKITDITSPTNETYQKFKSLLTSKGIKKEGLCFLSGKDLIQEFLSSRSPLKIHAEVLKEGLNPLADHRFTVKLPKILFDELDSLGTHFNLLVIEIPEIQQSPELSTLPPQAQVILPLGDPSNLGAALRSCEAFGIEEVILTQESANPFLPKALKASAGSTLRLKLLKTKALSELSTQHLIALDSQGQNLMSFEWPKQFRLVVGEEGPGLGDLLVRNKISIPTQGVESLNAVVALSVALYDYKKKSSK
jgi:TrmH family RNA methyltransferase